MSEHAYGEEPVARSEDPGTSWEAADSVDRIKLTTVRLAILDLLRTYGPLTDDDIWRGLEYVGVRDLTSPSGARTRRHELALAGLVRDSGRWKVGPTNRRMIAWQAVRP